MREREAATGILIAMILLACSIQIEAQEQMQSGTNSVTVSVERVRNGTIYKVNGQLTKDPMRPLGELLERHGDNSYVVAIFTSDDTLKDVTDVEIMASKVGFKNIRSFLSNPITGFMSEIKLGPSVRVPEDAYSH